MYYKTIRYSHTFPFFFPLFFIPFIIFALLFLSPSHILIVVTQIRGQHVAGSSPPPPHCGSCLAFFIARRFLLFLPSSTRVDCIPILAIGSRAFLFFCRRSKFWGEVYEELFPSTLSPLGSSGKPQKNKG